MDKLKDVALKVEFPNAHSVQARDEAVVLDFLELLGRPRELGAARRLLVDLDVWDEHENLSILKQGIPQTFPSEVVEEASDLLASLPGDPDEGTRVDQRHLMFMSIDDEGTDEVDDALALERTDDGDDVIWIAIADPTRYVKPDTRLFNEAARRLCSVYLPTGMLVL
jgi:exoribonuclease II